MDGLKLKGIIEAILFTSGKSIRKEEFLSLVDGVSEEEVDKAVRDLRQNYDSLGCSFCLEEVAHGYRLATRPEFGVWLNKFYKEKEKRHLSSASLETLAIIAYKQPVMRLEIETIRGVNSEGVLHSLLEVGLIRIMGRKQIPGRPILYGTTNKFLELFGLKNLADLPPLEELEKMLKEKEKKLETAAEEEEAGLPRLDSGGLIPKESRGAEGEGGAEKEEGQAAEREAGSEKEEPRLAEGGEELGEVKENQG